MEKEYSTFCVSCDVETELLVVDEEELPLFCPMCGEQTEWEDIAE